MKAKTFLDQEKVAEKTGLGGSGSHWTLTQLFGKTMEHAAHRSHLRKGGEARQSGETTFTTPDLLQLGLRGLCPRILSANSAPFLTH